MLRNYKAIKVRELQGFHANSRTHSEDQVQQIIKSIEEFGFTNPLLIDDSGVIIAGHGRLAAAIKMGLDEVPCIILSGLSEIQKAAYVIADNKIALNAGWDLDILRSQFNLLSDSDYDLDFTGFSAKEIAELIPDKTEAFCDEDECPEMRAETITKPGDVWILGDHRLMCGDSTVSTDVEKLLAKQSPNTMITDPPYGVSYEAGWRATAKNRTKTSREVMSNLQNDNRADWYDAYSLFSGAVAYVWHASSFTDIVMDNLKQAGFEIKQQIIWNKNIHALSRSDYHWKHEPCWYAVKKDGNRNWQGGRTQMTVWDIASVMSEKDKTSHPTQKPVELFVRSIEHHTNRGEYIYDPFAGSGTIMVACEKTKRRALMMEIDPKFCDVIINRYEKYSGNKAIREV